MCYDIKAQLHAQLRRARRLGNPEAVDEIAQKLLPFTDLPIFHRSGFHFPRLLIYRQDMPSSPCVAQWGLLPHWIRSVEQKKKLRAQTLNARWETLFEKPSFRVAARSGRCLLGIDGFYEHYHAGGKTYPYFVYRSDGEPLTLAGISECIEDPESGEELTTFSIVTVPANQLMGRIHNNPKARESRMPLVLPTEELEDLWLEYVERDLVEDFLKPIARPMEDGLLKAHTVGRLRGKEYAGNVPVASEKLTYPGLSEVSN